MFQEFPPAYVDFEYSTDSDGLPHPVCMSVHASGATRSYRFDQHTPVESPFDFSKYTMIGWHVWAELSCFLALGWTLPERAIDAAVEYGIRFNREVDRPRRGLYAALATLEIAAPFRPEDKELFQQLAAKGGKLTDDQMIDLIAYCESDVLATKDIYEAVMAEKFAEPYESMRHIHALIRGRHMIAVAKMMHRGIPLDRDRTQWIFDNREGIQERLIELVRRDYPGVFGKSSFNQEGFAAYLEEQGLLERWPRTPSGLLATGKQALKDMVRLFPRLRPLQEVAQVRGLMSRFDLRVFNGVNRVLPMEFWTKTGRASPRNTEYVMSVPSVFRNLISAPIGKVIYQLDFTSAEYLVGAALAKDRNMLDAYDSGDVYVGFGLSAGMSLEDAQAQRSVLKACQLGLGFGQRAFGLARTLGWRRIAKAQHYITLHRNTFARYHGWCEVRVRDARAEGYCYTQGGFRFEVGTKTKTTTLVNWHVQAEAQELFRHAVLRLDEAGVELLGLNHDSCLVLLNEGDDPAIVAGIMEDAAFEYLGHRMRVDIEKMEPKPSSLWDLICQYVPSQKDSILPPVLVHPPPTNSPLSPQKQSTPLSIKPIGKLVLLKPSR